MTEPRAKLGSIFAVLALGIGALSILQSAAIPAITEIINAFHRDAVSGAWVQTAILLSAAVCTPVSGRLADIFGKRQVLVVALTVFAIGNVVSALSQDFELLLAGRIMQGAGAGIYPVGFALVREVFPPERVRSTIGFMSGLVGVGVAIGLALGGVIVGAASYHWIFWLGATLGITAAVGAWLVVPPSPATVRGRLDIRGAAIFVIGVTLPVLAISQVKSWGWTGVRTLVTAGAGLLILAGWTRLQRRTVNPFANVATMASRPVLVTNLATMLVGLGMFGPLFMIPQIIQIPESSGYGLGDSVTAAGLLMVPGALTMLVVSQFSATIGVRFGSRFPLAIGGLTAGVGLLLIGLLHSTHVEMALFTMVFYAGLGLAHSAIPNLIIDAVPAEQTGEATGFTMMVRTVGAALGTQICGSILTTSAAGGSLVPSEHGFQTAFVVVAAVLGAAALLTLTIPKVATRTQALSTAQATG